MFGCREAYVCALFFGFLGAATLQASEFGPADYDVYHGDFNSDGCSDIYLKAKPRVMLIAGDVNTPIQIPPNGPSYKLASTDSSTQVCAYSALVVDEPETINTATLSSGYNYFSGDFNGDGYADALLQAPDASGYSYTIAGGDNGVSVLQVIGNGDGPAVHQGAATLLVADYNGDGRDDLITQTQTVYLSDNSGNFGATSEQPSNNNSIDPADIAATDQVGSTAGNFRVAENGAASYTIPIATAAGTAGVTPQLELSYNSQAGNGLLGKGWNIGGLSAISRCRQTLQQDGDALPLSWGPQDRFCLDGQRLMVVAGDYGAPNSQYRTEIDSFAKVVAKGGTIGHPDYFEVTRKDGSVSTYGYSGDSDAEHKAVADNGAVSANILSWSLKKFTDSVGNQMIFTYQGDSDHSGHRLHQVRYAFGSNSSWSLYQAYIQFNYEQRPDDKAGYIAGYKFGTGRRLASVVSYNEGDELRRYNLTYLDQTGNQPATDSISRLTGLQECVGTTCLPATTFDWSLPQPGIGGQTQRVGFHSDQDDRLMVDHRTPDINGDGVPDLVWLEADYDDDGRIHDHHLYYTLSTDSGYGSVVEVLRDGVDTDIPFKMEAIDYNADGRMDVAIWNNTNWQILLAQPSGATWNFDSPDALTDLPNQHKLTFTDFNSDGLTDAVYLNNGSLSVRYLERDLSQPATSARGYRFGAETTLLTAAELVKPASEPTIDELTPDDILIASADFNADGRGDILLLHRGCKISWNGAVCEDAMFAVTKSVSGYITEPWVGGKRLNTFEGQFLHARRWSDINSDGITDELFYNEVEDGNGNLQTGWFYRLGRGPLDDFTDPVLVLPMSTHPLDNAGHIERMTYSAIKQQVQLVDYNQDGFPDLVWHDTDNGEFKVKYWDTEAGDFEFADTVIRSTDGDERRAHFLTDANADGTLDYIYLNTGIGGYLDLHLSAQQNAPVNHITRITNGLGAETDIHYGTLATSGHYSRLNVGTTTTTFSGPCVNFNPISGMPMFSGECYYDKTLAHTDDFYRELNQDWELQLPAGSDTLGKDVNFDGKNDPILEINGTTQVVTSVDSSAPLPGNLNAKSTISYYYSHARMQASGRGFLGFQALTTVDEQTGVTTTTSYRQDFPFIGSPQSTRVYSAENKLLSESFNTWKLKTWNGSSHSDWDGATPATRLYAPYLAETVQKSYNLAYNGAADGTLLHTVTTTNSYDGYGNAGRITVTTDDATGGDLFVKDTVNQYGSSTWDREMGRLSRTTVTTTRNGAASTRTSAFTYLTGGNTKGLLHTEVVEPDNASLRVTTTYEYDSFGNKTKAITSGQGVASRYTRSEYDSYGRYLDTSYNSLEQRVSHVVARNSLGQPTQVRDINGVDTYSYYSKLGRKYMDRNETGSFAGAFLSRTDLANCPAGTAYKAKTTSAGGGESQQCFDKLARAVRSLERGFDGRWIATDVEFDSLGRSKHQSEPYFIGGGATYWSSFNYDILGRVTHVTLPDGSSGITDYNGYTLTETNDKGHSRTEGKNALGETVYVTDNLGSTITYAYDPQGNMIAVTDSAANVSSITYDLLGRKTAMSDPDKGNWTYNYNVYGELISQTDGKGQTSSMTYDVLGRMVSRIDRRADNSIEGNTTWTYDTAANGLGQLASVHDSVSNYIKAVGYDSYGRVSETATSLGQDGTYYQHLTYDGFSRVQQAFDAANDAGGSAGEQGVRNIYNSYGYLSMVADTVNGSNGQPRTVYREITGMDARGNITGEIRGDGVSVARTYDPATGRIKTINGFHLFSGAIQDLSYHWDTLGNLTDRTEQSGNKNLSETFGYDGLNRLTSYRVDGQSTNGQSTKTVTYDALGNIVNKSDVGNYSYGAGNAGPHAVTSAGGATYSYDANGNNTSGDGRSISYSTFDKPLSISKGGHTTEFEYGPDRSRYKRIDIGNNNQTTTTVYVGGVEFITRPDNSKEIKRYVAGTVITLSYAASGQYSGDETRYLYHDHLGSLDVITNELGQVVQEQSFDAWGQRRNATDWKALLNEGLIGFDYSITTRGYTGHEMLDEVGVIHMNGRIYDPKLGRFLQADPIVQDPLNTQSLNRYSYVLNNPLNATDPSGYVASMIVGAIMLALEVEIVIVAVTVGLTAFVQGVAAGMDFSQAFIAGVSSGVMTFLGGGGISDFGTIMGSELLAQAAAMGVVGGITGVLQGGKFGHGFASSAVGVVAGGTLGKRIGSAIGGTPGKIVAGAVVGGTVSEVTGGKFANGAAYGAFSAIVQSAIVQSATTPPSDNCTPNCPKTTEYTPEQKAAILKEVEALTTDLQAGKYGSVEEAAAAIHDSGLGDFFTGKGIEGWAVIDGNSYSIKEFGVGSAAYATGVYDGSFRPGRDSVWHSHPSGKDIHSGDFDSGFLAGAKSIWASGSRLTGYNLRLSTNPFVTRSQYRRYRGSWRFTKDIYTNGRWSSESGTFKK